MRIVLVVALAAACAHATLPNCRAPGPAVPGAVAPCDVDVDCAWCERNQLSFDFLCCESGKWIGPHLVNPMSFYLVWNSVPWTIVVFLGFEVFEALVLTSLGSFDVLFVDRGDSETLAGSLVGDALIQGGLGLFIGYLLRVIFLAPTLISSPARARAIEGGRGRRAVYFVVYALLLLTFALPGLTTASGVRWGLAVNGGLVLLWVWLVYPLALTRPIDDAMLWRQLDGSRYGGARKAGLFAAWGLTVVAAYALHVPGAQPVISINEWYQQWLIVGPWALVLAVVAIVVSARRRDWFSVLVVAGSLFVAEWLAAWFGYSVLQRGDDTRLVYAGIVPLIGAAGAFALAAFGRWTRTRVPGTRAGDTYDAALATRVAARTVVPVGGDDDNKTPFLSTVSEQFAPPASLRRRVRA